MNPVFYDIEASGLDGYPIEVGWAWYDAESRTVVSEAHLIKPPVEWNIAATWDEHAESLHGISLQQLAAEGESAAAVAKHMNNVLAKRTIYATSPLDQAWLEQIFKAANIQPLFTVGDIGADILIGQQSRKLLRTQRELQQIIHSAETTAPHIHRAGPDARHLATLWRGVMHGVAA